MDHIRCRLIFSSLNFEAAREESVQRLLLGDSVHVSLHCCQCGVVAVAFLSIYEGETRLEASLFIGTKGTGISLELASFWTAAWDLKPCWEVKSCTLTTLSTWVSCVLNILRGYYLEGTSENGFAPLLCRSTTRLYNRALRTVLLYRKPNIITPLSLCKYNFIWLHYLLEPLSYVPAWRDALTPTPAISRCSTTPQRRTPHSL